jgi:hypothetical protein
MSIQQQSKAWPIASYYGEDFGLIGNRIIQHPCDRFLHTATEDRFSERVILTKLYHLLETVRPQDFQRFSCYRCAEAIWQKNVVSWRNFLKFSNLWVTRSNFWAIFNSGIQTKSNSSSQKTALWEWLKIMFVERNTVFWNAQTGIRHVAGRWIRSETALWLLTATSCRDWRGSTARDSNGIVLRRRHWAALLHSVG